MSHITRKYKNHDFIEPTRPEMKCKQGDGGFVISHALSQEMAKQCTRNASPIRQAAKSNS